MKILIAGSEVVPFAKTGGLADVLGALPRALRTLGIEVRVIMPKYKCISDTKFVLKPSHLSPLYFEFPMGISTERASLRLGTLPPLQRSDIEGDQKEVPVYFIEQNKYFDRDGFYGDEYGDYPDNGQRFSFFCRAALESLRVTLYKPDIIHCNDWQTGLIPVYLKTVYREDPFLKNISTLYTIHNLAYQGIFDPGILDFAGLAKELFNYHQLEFYGKVNFAKAGLVFSDAINTVSQRYAQEIMTPEFGCRLEGVLQERSRDIYGILNGIDYEEWNPSTDKNLRERYDDQTLEGKQTDKKALQEEMGLPQKDVALFGFVGRLAAQKGLDILSDALPVILKEDIQIVMLGKGDASYEKLCREFSLKNPQKVKVVLGFDVPLSHRIYAGSDFFLMPSYFEPCGLGQMIAMRYGTVPLVHSTGGLADTVMDYNEITEEGNGFSFEEYSSSRLFETFKRALSIYQNREKWMRLVRKIMGLRFSWENSAKRYIELYKKIAKFHSPEES